MTTYEGEANPVEIPKSECDRAHWRRMLKRQLKKLGYHLTDYVNSIEWIQAEIVKLGAEPFKPCFARKGLGNVCMLPADGHVEHKYQQFGQQEQEIETEETNFLRYPEPAQQVTTRKVLWLEYRENGLLEKLDTLERGNRGVNSEGEILCMGRPHGSHVGVFYIFNETLGKEQTYGACADIIPWPSSPLLIAHEKELELERSKAASLLGRQGGLAKSEVKAKKSKENGIKGGRKRSFSALDMEEDKGESNG